MNDLTRKIKQLMDQGKGRRIISKELGISERRVRRICKSLVDQNLASYPSAGRPFGIKEEIIIADDIEIEEEQTPQVDYSIPQISKYKDTSGERVIILSDIHIPYEDKVALEIAINYMIDCDPDHIVLNGDIADMYTVSSYDKYTRNRPSIQDEIDAVVHFLRRLKLLFPEAKISFLVGNHEVRLQKYIQKNADALVELDVLSLSKLFKLEEMQIDCYPPNRPLQIGKDLLITHGELCRKAAGSTARGHRDKYNSSIAVGHIHRGSIAYQRVGDGQHIMIENPCLCKMDVEYGNFFDWLHGFTELLVSEEGDITAKTHAIVNYRLTTMDGVVYDGN